MLDAVKKDIDARLSSLRENEILKIGLANTLMDPEKLEAFKTDLQQHFPDMELFYLPLTMSIGTHTGPGALGIGAVRYYRRDKK